MEPPSAAKDRAAAETPAPTIVLKVLLTHQPVRPAVLESTMREAASVWSEAGIHLRWRDAGGAPDRAAGSALHVVVAESCPEHNPAVMPLAWIIFTDGVATPRIVLCYRNAEKLLGLAGSAAESVPSVVHDAIIARMMGRAVAHEIGHYLLGPQHATAGLMRSVHTVDRLAGLSRSPFRLVDDEPARAILRARALPCAE
jgi:hypothetical protein